MAADILSDVLRGVRLRGAVFYDVLCDEQWVAEAPPARELAPAVMPGLEHVIEYHVVTRGGCWAGVVGEPPLRMTAGDVVMFPQGDAHVMSSAPGMRAAPLQPSWVVATRDLPKPIPVRYALDAVFAGAEVAPLDAPTHIVCGFIGCDLKPFNPLIATLPRVLHLPATESDAWIGPMLGRAVAESRVHRAGGEAMLQRISEMVFVDAVRRYVETLPPQGTGWLAGLRDRHIGKALAAMHAEPARPWSLEALASAAALSRSALHERFAQLVGMPPMHYLAQWRMQVAAGLLRSTRASVASIALDVGYESEAAFSRAFKRLVGAPPAAWRRAERGVSRPS
jgi:AraC-like DNA-binding protein